MSVDAAACITEGEGEWQGWGEEEEEEVEVEEDDSSSSSGFDASPASHSAGGSEVVVTAVVMR